MHSSAMASPKPATTLPPEFVVAATGARMPICVDCGEPFAHDNAPRDPALLPIERCPDCRESRRSERNQRNREALAHTGDRRRSPQAPGSDGSGPLVLTTCADCQRAFRAPFTPDPSRPILCRSCWNAHNGI